MLFESILGGFLVSCDADFSVLSVGMLQFAVNWFI